VFPNFTGYISLGEAHSYSVDENILFPLWILHHSVEKKFFSLAKLQVKVHNGAV
jgi:hypothetical protein